MPKKDKEKKTKQSRFRKPLWLGLIFFGSVIVLAVVAFTIYSLTLPSKAYYGLKLAGESLGGKNEQAITDLAKTKSDKFLTEKITIKAEAKEYQLSPTEITLNYDPAETAKRAMDYARKNDLIGFWDRLTLLFSSRNITPAYRYNETALTDKIKSYAAELDQPEKDYALKIASGQVEILTERADGKRLNQDKLLRELNDHFKIFSTDQIQLAVEVKKPSVTLDATVFK